MSKQLPLPVQLPDDATFSSFEAGHNNLLLEHLRLLLQKKAELITYISGELGSGKSHLLYSICASSEHSVLVDFSQIDMLSPDMMSGLEHSEFVCLDNIHLLQNNLPWQQAIFDLINRGKESGQCCFIITGDRGPKQLALELADLQSRLTWGLSFNLTPLTDELRIAVLIKRAGLRGMNMPEEVARYLLTHCKRDMPTLMSTLEQLDTLSLQQKRKLTIPFVKQALAL